MLVRVDFISLLLTALFLVCISGSASFTVPKDRFLGIAPQDSKYYRSDVIKCRNGLKQFTAGQLNDDFCDCPDGTDEPGTAACPDAKFYCRNAGHVGVILFSSRVNDGICDCCDGSDEYDGKVKCPNVCWEAGKVARDMLKKKIATYQDGVIIRRKEVEHAKGALAKEEEELSKLKNEEKIVKGLVQQLKERKEQVEKAEEKQHLENEKEEKLRKEAADMANKEINKIEQELQHEKNIGPNEEKTEPKVSETLEHDKVGLLEDSPSDVESLEGLSKESNKLPAEVQQHEIDEGPHLTSAVEHTVGVGDDLAVSSTSEEFAVASKAIEEAKPDWATGQDMDEREDASENTEGLSKEELGRVVASRWTGETIEKETKQDYAKDDSEEGYQHEEMPEYIHDTEDSGYASQIDDDRHNYEHEDADDTAPYNSDFDSDDEAGESMLSRLEKIPKTIRKLFLAVKFFFSPVDKSEAAQIRKEYEEQSKKLSKMQSRISSLSKKLKQDFGPDKEFYSFYGRCFESKQNKYVYKVCPFKESSQEEGHHTTRLGSWDKFEDSYRVMIFSDGEKCWNGPHRSMKVKLSCGLKNELKDVGEPSRCEYEALLSTPAACVEQKLKELQHELDSMDQKRPGSRDEL